MLLLQENSFALKEATETHQRGQQQYYKFLAPSHWLKTLKKNHGGSASQTGGKNQRTCIERLASTG